jgi:outer membrane receptor protein involved in Fe transport
VPIPGAEVAGGGATALTDERGSFTLTVGESEVLLRVHANGFSDYEARVVAGRPLRVTLHPAGITEAVTVTAARSADRLAETASAVTVMTSGSMLTTAAGMPDDALRSVPGFSLFRRSSSRVANPTTQGVSLRGLAASGASRGLVLADGIPLNDPYGAWVYWDRIPQAAIDRIEIVRGSGTESLYGLNAIGGALQLFTVRPRTVTGRGTIEGGEHGMWRGSGYGGTRRGAWDGFVSAERYVLDGFPIVSRAERGAVDVNAGLRFSSALVSVGWSGPSWAIDARANWLNEDRENGTPLQKNDTNVRSAAISGRAGGLGGLFSFAAYSGDTNYDQSFSAVSADRSTERLTVRQRVASENEGGSLQWSRDWHGSRALVGGEVQRVAGGGSPANSGTQHDYALYSQLVFDPATRLRLLTGVRVGRWTTVPQASTGLDRRTGYVVPRLALTWSQTPSVSLVASWSRPERTPTLNELYRDFQVGSVFTEHNVLLRPEDAHAVEGGVLVRHRSISTRLIGFWTGLDGAITNVTLAQGGGQILRQRRNAGTIRARGLEAEAEWRPAGWATLVGSAALTGSRFVQSDEPGLTGKRVSQVPRWQTVVSARVTRGRTIASVDWRSTGAQFDDDQNAFKLRRASVMDLFLGRSLPRGLQPFVAAENVFDAEVDVGRTPVRTIGTPRSVRVGLRILY